MDGVMFFAALLLLALAIVALSSGLTAYLDGKTDGKLGGYERDVYGRATRWLYVLGRKRG